MKKMWDTLMGQLKTGTSPEKLALTCAIGMVVGTLPIWGITTGLCFILAALFRVNIIILQMVNYAIYPLQLLLILPFIKAGTYLFQVNPLPYSLDQLISLFQTDFWKTIEEVGVALSLGVGVWALVSIFVFTGVYSGTLILFKKWQEQLRQRELKSE